MNKNNEIYTALDFELIKLVIGASISSYATKSGIALSSVSLYVKSDLAFYSRITYSYVTKNCNNDEEKKKLLTSSFIIELAEYITDFYFKVLSMRFDNIKTGLKLDSEYSHIVELTCAYLIKMIEPYAKQNPNETLVMDFFLKFFNQAMGVLRMLNLNLPTEAFSNWRTLHEAECVIKLLVSGGKTVQDAYVRHLLYNTAYRHGISSKEETDQIFVEIKSKMAEHKLKSKDMKKFIEYGWLYSCEEFDESNPEYKLNFRCGLQKCAGLEEYSEWYEMASEIAHSSPIFFYSNNTFFSDFTSLNLADILMRGVNYFNEYIKDKAEFNFEANKKHIDLISDRLKNIVDRQDDSFYTKYKNYLSENEE